MATDRRAVVRLVSVVIEYVAHDLGHWCRPCALPSGIRMWRAVRRPEGMTLQVHLWCDQCGRSDVVIDDDRLRS